MYTDVSVLGLQTPPQDLLNESMLDSDLQNIDFDFAIQAITPVAPNLLGELGDVQPFSGNAESLQWVAEQLQDCPGNFAKTGENMFMHRSMYYLQSPTTIKTAFGICTASQMVTPVTKAIFTSSLEGEISALLDEVEVKGIPDGLGRLQAMVLYQILRFWSGDSKQQSAAEQQKGVLNVWALQLLQKLPTGLPHPRTLKDMILAESVYRTVTTTFLLHALASVFKYGVCTELPTLALLPVSVGSEVWESSDILCAAPADSNLQTMKYGEWTDMWISFPQRRKLNSYQKMLMVACKGKAKVEELEAEMV